MDKIAVICSNRLSERDVCTDIRDTRWSSTEFLAYVEQKGTYVVAYDSTRARPFVGLVQPHQGDVKE